MFQRLGRPVCLGVSRKGFLGRLLRPARRTSPGRVAGRRCQAMSREAAQMVRVHDVEETRDAVTVFSVLDG